MNEIISTLTLYFNYSFVRYAMIVGILVALCSSLLGVTLVLKRFSFIGDGLSHVAFLAMAVAAIFQFTNNMPIILVITILAAVLVLCMGDSTFMKGDATIAMMSVTALALGYLLMNLFPTSTNISSDVCTTLFGSTSILTLTKEQVLLSAVLSVAVVVMYVLFYNKVFAITFDEDFTRAIGINVGFYNFVIAVIIAVILTSALIIFPALSTMRLFKSFKGVVISSAVFSVICAALGIVVSILAGTPVGSTIVGIEIIAYIFCFAVGQAVR